MDGPEKRRRLTAHVSAGTLLLPAAPTGAVAEQEEDEEEGKGSPMEEDRRPGDLARAAEVMDIMHEFLKAMYSKLEAQYRTCLTQESVMTADLDTVLACLDSIDLRDRKAAASAAAAASDHGRRAISMSSQQRPPAAASFHRRRSSADGAAGSTHSDEALEDGTASPSLLSKRRRTTSVLPVSAEARSSSAPLLSRLNSTPPTTSASVPDFPSMGLLTPPSHSPRPPRIVQKDLDMFACVEPEEDVAAAEHDGRRHSTTSSAGCLPDKWSRLQTQLPIMESIYLQRWWESQATARGGGGPAEAQGQKEGGPCSAPPPTSPPTLVASSPPTHAAGEGKVMRVGGVCLSEHLSRFAKDLNSFSKYSRIITHASLQQSSGSNSNSQMISSLSFGCADEMFAVAGTATRKIKLYAVQPLLRQRAGGDGGRGPSASPSTSRASAAQYPLVEFEVAAQAVEHPLEPIP